MKLITCSILAALLLCASLPAIAGDPRAARTPSVERSNDGEAVPRYLLGNVILKLNRGATNLRGDVLFGLPELDEVMVQIGAEERRALFPNAPYLPHAPQRAAGADEISQGFDRVYVVRYSAMYDPAWVAERMVETGLVDAAEPYYIFRPAYTPNDPRLPTQYWIDMIRMKEAWEVTTGDTTIVIAICDSGVEWTHEDLVDNVYTNPGETGRDGQGRDKSSNGVDDDNNGFKDDWRGWDFVGSVATLEQAMAGLLKPDNDPAPINSWQDHGTGVAGCAASVSDNGKGVASPAFRAKFLPLKMSIDAVNTPSLFGGYDAIRYAADMGARVINCSWGSVGATSASPVFQSVIDYAISKGALVVGASGNESNNNDETPFFPGSLKRVLSVGATTPRDSASGYSHYGVSVKVWAPGDNIATTTMAINGNYRGQTGTSFAAPIVSGVAALVFSQHPDWTPEQVAMQLRVTGDRIKVRTARMLPLAFRRVNALNAVSMNRDLADGSPSNLPGVDVVSYTINGKSVDTIKSLTQSVTVRVELKNFLAPTKNLTVQAMGGQTLTTVAPATVPTIGTLQTGSVDLQVKIDPAAPTIYSEGRQQLILRLSDGQYEDYLAVAVPIFLPGWHQLMNSGTSVAQQYVGSSIHAVSSRNAWSVANIGNQQNATAVFTRTATGGLVWSGWKAVGLAGEPAYSIHATSDRRAWVGTGPNSRQAAIYRTTDAGNNWQRAAVATITPFVDGIHFFDNSNGIFIGDPLNGRWGIGTTTDGGATWTPLATPLMASSSAESGWANSVAAYGDNVWFGTNTSRIYYSTDRGQTWRSAATHTKNPMGIAFTDEENGMAYFQSSASSGGVDGLAASTNGGESWRSVSLPFTGAVPDGITAVEGTTRIFVGTQNGVYETDDYGKSWRQMAMPPITFNGFALTSAIDADGSMTAYGTNVYSQIMGYKEKFAVTSSVRTDETMQSEAIAELGQNMPNPFGTSPNYPYSLTTTIRFYLRQSADVELALYYADGTLASILTSGRKDAGHHEVKLEAGYLPAGQYHYVLTLAHSGERHSRSLILVR